MLLRALWLTYITDNDVHFVGYLYIMDLINAQKMEHINLLKPTGYVIHQQFNIQQLYALPTLYLCVLYLSENKQQLASLTS